VLTNGFLSESLTLAGLVSKVARGVAGGYLRFGIADARGAGFKVRTLESDSDHDVFGIADARGAGFKDLRLAAR